MSMRDYVRGFTDALDYVLALFNKLKSRGKINCDDCVFVEKIGELLLLAKEKQFERIERELGYLNLH